MNRTSACLLKLLVLVFGVGVGGVVLSSHSPRGFVLIWLLALKLGCI
jgi:hypothetical protein